MQEKTGKQSPQMALVLDRGQEVGPQGQIDAVPNIFPQFLPARLFFHFRFIALLLEGKRRGFLGRVLAKKLLLL